MWNCDRSLSGILVAIAVCLGLAAAVDAQEKAAPPFPTEVVPDGPAAPAPAADATAAQAGQVTVKALQDLQKQVDAAKDLTDEQKAEAKEQIDQGIASLKAADEFKAALKTLDQSAQNIESQRQQAQARLDALQKEKTQLPSPYTPLPKLEQLLATKQQEEVQAQTALSQADASLEERKARQDRIKSRLQEIPAALETVSTELAKLAGDSGPSLLNQARELRLLADRERLKREPPALQAEAAYLAAKEAAGLAQLERQISSAKLAQLKKEITELQAQILKKKSSEARDRADVAKALAESAKLPQLKEIYQSNFKIVEDEIELREKLKHVAEQSLAAKSERESLKSRFDEIQQREDRIGSSTTFGIRLRDLSRFLPDPAQLRAEVNERTPTLQQAQLDKIEATDKLARIENTNEVVESLLGDVADQGFGSNEEREALAEQIRDAVTQQQRYLSELISAYDNYIDGLDELNSEQELLAEQAAEFRNFIDERILWIPSHPLLRVGDVFDDHGWHRLVSYETWSRPWNVLRADLLRNSTTYALAIIVWVGLLITRGRQRKAIHHHGQKASSRLNTAMNPTTMACLWTLLRASLFALPLLFLGWRGLVSGGMTTRGLSWAIVIIGLWVWWIDLIRQVCRPNGLGISHFQWPARANQVVRLRLATLAIFGSPILFIIAALHSQAQDGDTDGLERAFGIIFFLILAWTLHRLFSRKIGVWKEWTEAHQGSWLERLSGMAHWLAVAVPLALAGLMVAGYAYTAQKLAVRLAETLMLVTIAILTRALLLRWLMLRQRRLAIQRAREVRAALAEAQSEKESSSAIVLEAQEARTNLVDVSAQSKRLLSTSIVMLFLVLVWVIWVDVLPALQVLSTVTVPGIELSLSQLLSAGLGIILFTTAARNIPGLLEITLLERLPLERSVRYAIGAMVRYTIVVVGILAIGGGALGITWDKVQWLAAALTFGLGFGLQEIFANFISGLIILFEQPLRVGDIVTIDNVTGTVSRIRIRSTTITDWDRKEYVVPNKEFITGRLLNWTLTDTTNRVVVEVGVSYDSDPVQVREILNHVVVTQQYVLTEPAPIITFEAFGSSSLNFVARCFLSSYEHRLETIHSLHVRIFQAFAEAGIEIPFPQTDLHVRSMVGQFQRNGEETKHRPSSDSNGDETESLTESTVRAETSSRS